MDNMLNEFDEKDRSIKTNDLKTRERVNFVVDATIMKKIRDLSAERKIPMSRMIDHAIATTYGLFAKSIFTNTFLINHEIKLYIYKEVHSDEVKDLINILKTNDINYIIGDCLLAMANKRAIGSILSFYLNDGDDYILDKCIQTLKFTNTYFSVFLDNELLSDDIIGDATQIDTSTREHRPSVTEAIPFSDLHKSFSVLRDVSAIRK